MRAPWLAWTMRTRCASFIMAIAASALAGATDMIGSRPDVWLHADSKPFIVSG